MKEMRQPITWLCRKTPELPQEEACKMDMLTSLLTQPLQILRQGYLHVQSYNLDLKPLPT